MIYIRYGFMSVLATLAIGCAIAAVAAHGGRFSSRLDVLTHFAPIYLVIGSMAVVVGGLLGRSSPQVFVMPGLIAAVASLALMAPELLSPPIRKAAGNSARLKIIQFNAWGGNKTPETAVAWLLAENPDIIVLEEGGQIGARLAVEGHYHRACRSCYATLYSKSKPLSENSVRRGQKDRPPVSMATYLSSSGTYTVFGVHRAWPTRLAASAEQSLVLEEMVARSSSDRAIVAGDFNSTPWSFARRAEDRNLGLIRRTRALFTWPAERVSHNRLPLPFPLLPIDHVYAGPGWATVSVRRGPRLGSDHYPVVVVLSPAADPAQTGP